MTHDINRFKDKRFRWRANGPDVARWVQGYTGRIGFDCSANNSIGCFFETFIEAVMSVNGDPFCTAPTSLVGREFVFTEHFSQYERHSSVAEVFARQIVVWVASGNLVGDALDEAASHVLWWCMVGSEKFRAAVKEVFPKFYTKIRGETPFEEGAVHTFDVTVRVDVVAKDLCTAVKFLVEDGMPYSRSETWGSNGYLSTRSRENPIRMESVAIEPVQEEQVASENVPDEVELDDQLDVELIEGVVSASEVEHEGQTILAITARPGLACYVCGIARSWGQHVVMFKEDVERASLESKLRLGADGAECGLGARCQFLPLDDGGG